MSLPPPPRALRTASWILTVVALLIGASAALILFAPIDVTNFATQSGVEWGEFSAGNPDASSYLIREARLLAVGYLTLGLVTAIVAWGPLRNASRSALVALSIFTTGLLGASVIFLGSGDTTIGATYLAAAIVSAGTLAVCARVSPRG